MMTVWRSTVSICTLPEPVNTHVSEEGRYHDDEGDDVAVRSETSSVER